MTTTILSLMMFTMVMLATFTHNPVKLIFIIMSMSLIIFSNLSVISSSIWFPMLFFLLFMGGVLVMFLILSSLLPNQKMTKSKNLKMALIMPVPLAMMIWGAKEVSNLKEYGMNNEMTEFFISTMNLAFMTFLVLMYFLSFIAMLMAEKSTLRMESCLQEQIL